MISFANACPKQAALILPVWNADTPLTSKNVFMHCSPVQKRAIKKILKEPLPTSGIIPVYTADGLVILILVEKSIDQYTARKEGEKIFSLAKQYKQENIAVAPGVLWNTKEVFEFFIDGIFLGTYSFNKYKGALEKEKNEKNKTVEVSSITLLSKNNTDERKNWQKGVAITKDIINTPPSIATPSFVEESIREYFTPVDGVEIITHTQSDLKKMGAGGILAVGQASSQESRFVTIVYNGAASSMPYIGMVGKGVTYDTGGLSVKPGSAMRGMKKDLGGAATIIGAMYSIAASGIQKNVVAVIPLAENAIGENAYKPDDVITMMNGKTVEVTNTDAEGRLLLGDALHYIQKEYNPGCIIDAATLTGACVYAIGEDIGAAFSNNENLFTVLNTAAEKTEEPIWRLPLYSRYKPLINSKIADIVNAAFNFKAGTIQAALFLQHFIENDIPWAHLDIAYSSFDSKSEMATGMHVRTLYEFTKEWKG